MMLSSVLRRSAIVASSQFSRSAISNKFIAEKTARVMTGTAQSQTSSVRYAFLAPNYCYFASLKLLLMKLGGR
jgi:hypothetical protein